MTRHIQMILMFAVTGLVTGWMIGMVARYLVDIIQYYVLQ